MSTVPRLRDRLALIKDPQQILSMLMGRQTDGIVASGRLLFYTDPRDGVQRHVNGLLPVLASVFWPDDAANKRKTALEAAKKRAKKEASFRSRAAAASGVSFGLGGKHAATRPAPKPHGMGGLAHGTLVHEQLADLLLIDPESFANKYGSMQPETLAVVTFVEGEGIVPILGEFPVADGALGIVARFDMMGARASDGTVIFYEYKTGSKNCFAAASAVSMAASLDGVLPDSELNRAVVQLAFSVFIATKAYPNLTRFEAYVLHPGDTVDAPVQKFPVPMSFLLKYCTAMYADVLRVRRRPEPTHAATGLFAGTADF